MSFDTEEPDQDSKDPNTAIELKGRENEKLALSRNYQHAIIGHLVDHAFAKIVIQRIKASWFVDEGDRDVWRMHYDFWVRNKGKLFPAPGVDEKFSHELLNCEEFTKMEPRKQGLIRKALTTAANCAALYSKEKIMGELEDWLKARLYHKLINESAQLFNKGKFKEAYNTVQNQILELKTATFDSGDVQDMDLGHTLQAKDQEYVGAITFGAKLVDDRLVDAQGHSTGGLLPGDTTVLLAPVNVGKTTTMLTVAATNVALGRYVLLTTHEGRALDLKLKFWQSLLRCTRNQLDEMFSRNVVVNGHDMKWWEQQVRKYLTFVPLYGKTIEETTSMVRILHQGLMPLNNGKGYALWIDDYPGTVTTDQASKGNLSRRERDDIVYGQVVDLAGELKFHALCAIQSNREGAKINKGTSVHSREGRLLTMEDVSESYGPMMRATNVVSINRDPKAMAKGYITFYICKSRSSKTGWAITCKSRFDLACTHSNSGIEIYQGGQWGDSGFAYEDGESYSDKAEQFLASYANTEVPVGRLWEAASAS